MPFQMTHLSIAYNIVSTTPKIKNPNDFILGAIAPDSVHFRDNYNSDMKKVTHLCIGDEKWGRVTNNKEWLENVLKFLNENKQAENIDFMRGYCSHIIADIQNNIKIWTPFLLEHDIDIDKGFPSGYHDESYNIDYELYLRNPNRKEIFDMVESGIGYDIEGVAYKDDIEKMKRHILYNQFENRECVDVSSNRYATLSGIEGFINEETKYIKSILF